MYQSPPPIIKKETLHMATPQPEAAGPLPSVIPSPLTPMQLAALTPMPPERTRLYISFRQILAGIRQREPASASAACACTPPPRYCRCSPAMPPLSSGSAIADTVIAWSKPLLQRYICRCRRQLAECCAARHRRSTACCRSACCRLPCAATCVADRSVRRASDTLPAMAPPASRKPTLSRHPRSRRKARKSSGKIPANLDRKKKPTGVNRHQPCQGYAGRARLALEPEVKSTKRQGMGISIETKTPKFDAQLSKLEQAYNALTGRAYLQRLSRFIRIYIDETTQKIKTPLVRAGHNLSPCRSRRSTWRGPLYAWLAGHRPQQPRRPE